MTVKKRRTSLSRLKIKLLRLQPKRNSCFVGSIDGFTTKRTTKLAISAVIWQRIIKNAMNRSQIVEVAKINV